MSRKKIRTDCRVYHLYAESDVLDTFQRLYPSCLKRFLENAIKIANNDEKMFDTIMFPRYHKDME